jgi:hypothetical protein
MNEDEIILDEEDFNLVEEEGTPTSEVNEETNEEEVVNNEEVKDETTEQQGEDKDKQLLEYLNSKGIKYNGESVKVESLDDLVSTYQKGLNYDKMKAKTDEDNLVMEYIRGKAKSANMTTGEYINSVKEYEKQQEEQRQKEQMQELIDGGLSEEIARSVVETMAFKNQLKEEKAELEKAKEEQKAKEQKDKEYEEFLQAYPNVKAEEIPKEVFEATKDGKSLLNAYTEYENKVLKEKIKQMEQNNKNASNSVVTPTSNGSGTEQQTKDAFLEGFDSEL